MKEILKKALVPGTKIQISTITNVLYEIYEEKDIDGVDSIVENNKDKNIYWLGGINPEKKGRAKDDDITKKNYLYIDFDIRATYENDPTKKISDKEIIMAWDWMKEGLNDHEDLNDWHSCIFTGNGLHVYYFFDDVIEWDKKDYSELVSGLLDIAAEQTMMKKEVDRACINIGRLARLPGSVNQKTGKESFIVEINKK